ncbi:hypothetical protein [Derxia lacustris]|uniref:hypothetical protein n=1 Tax=Derxia lacustris TaxID=764842 RepID=UPI00111BFBB1|nr:hypothetical protein [Derxia lacustris]
MHAIPQSGDDGRSFTGLERHVAASAASLLPQQPFFARSFPRLFISNAVAGELNCNGTNAAESGGPLFLSPFPEKPS